MDTPTSPEDRQRIRDDNDRFRMSGGGEDGFFLLTAGVRALGDLAILELLQLVRTYNAFSPENDPWGEHDFGRIDFAGHVIYWKIDYYDQDLQYYHDPRTPGCRRVLTVLLASEY